MVEESKQSAGANPFDKVKEALEVDGKTYQMYKLEALQDPRYHKLPFSIRVLLESAVRNCDDFNIKCKSEDELLTLFSYRVGHRNHTQLESFI